jgi:hypothetical protein
MSKPLSMKFSAKYYTPDATVWTNYADWQASQPPATRPATSKTRTALDVGAAAGVTHRQPPKGIPSAAIGKPLRLRAEQGISRAGASSYKLQSQILVQAAC